MLWSRLPTMGDFHLGGMLEGGNEMSFYIALQNCKTKLTNCWQFPYHNLVMATLPIWFM